MNKTPYFATCFVALVFVTATVSAQPGAPDLTFGDNGIVKNQWLFDMNEQGGMTVNSAGKIVVKVHTHFLNYLLQFNPDGTPDVTFANEGKLQMANSYDFEQGNVVTTDAADRILALSVQGQPFDSWIYIYRYNPDGTKDLSFGTGGNGEVVTKLKTVHRGLFIQSDGKIVVAGFEPGKIASIERYNEDGTVDVTFNGTGKMHFETLPKSIVFAITQQPDGKLLVTGNTNNDMFLARVNTDGTLDTGFDGDGIAIADEDGTLAGQGIAVRPDGTIIISGHSETIDESSMLLWAFLPDGTRDNSFGSNGLVTLFSGAANNFGWFVFPDGDTAVMAGGCVFNGDSTDPVLYRIMNDGTLDNSFGNSGIAGNTFTCGQFIQINAMKTPDNRYMICGTGYHDGNNRVALSKFLPGGLSDNTFGVNGNVLTSIYQSSSSSAPNSELFLTTQLPDGRILVIGSDSLESVYVARYNADGSVDSSYAEDGIGVYQNFSKYLYNQEMADGDSIFYVAEFFEYLSTGLEDLKSPISDIIGIHRISADGTPDSSFGGTGIIYAQFDTIEISDIQSSAVQPDGKLIITGKIGLEAVYLLRFNNDGSLDPSFDNDGVRIITGVVPGNDSFLEVRGDGKIMLVVFLNIPDSLSNKRVYRLLADGTFDDTFGTGGYVENTIVHYDAGESVLQPDNKLLMLIAPNSDHESLFRLNEDGSIDTGFGINGEVTLETDGHQLPGFTVQADGKIVLGTVLNDKAVVTRLMSDGSPDLTFGTDGSTLIPGINDYVRLTPVMQDDGKILLHGSITYAEGIITRLFSDFQIHVDEAGNGKALTMYPNPVDDQLTIQLANSVQHETLLEVIDIYGRILLRQTVSSSTQKIELNVKELPSGYYLLRLATSTGFISGSFIRQD